MKTSWAGPGHDPWDVGFIWAAQTSPWCGTRVRTGEFGPRPMICSVICCNYCDDIHPAPEAARVFSQAARATAHDMARSTVLLHTTWHYSTTTTTSALPMRRPTGFHLPRHGPAGVQAVPQEQKSGLLLRWGIFPIWNSQCIPLPGERRNNNVVLLLL